MTGLVRLIWSRQVLNSQLSTTWSRISPNTFLRGPVRRNVYISTLGRVGSNVGKRTVGAENILTVCDRRKTVCTRPGSYEECISHGIQNIWPTLFQTLNTNLDMRVYLHNKGMYCAQFKIAKIYLSSRLPPRLPGVLIAHGPSNI